MGPHRAHENSSDTIPGATHEVYPRGPSHVKEPRGWFHEPIGAGAERRARQAPPHPRAVSTSGASRYLTSAPKKLAAVAPSTIRWSHEIEIQAPGRT